MSFITKVLLLLLFVAFCGVFIVWDTPLQMLQIMVSDMGPWAYVAYVLILVIAVVAMPVTVMPLIPMAAMAIGPLPTALLSVIGWTLGGVIAFVLARHIGRPILSRYINLDKISEIEKHVPERSHVILVILLRLTLPVDLVSYALGFSQTLTFKSFFIGTLIGVIWFSFAFAYLGEALLTGDSGLLLQIGLPSIALFAGAWLVLRTQNRDK